MCKKILRVQKAFQHGLFGQPSSCWNTHILCAKAAVLSHHSTWGCCWGMPGRCSCGSGRWAGQYPGRAPGRSNILNMCLLSSQQPRSLSLARHALGTGMQKPLSQGGWKKLSFSVVIFPSPWAFSANVNKALIKQIFVHLKFPNLILGSKNYVKIFFWLFLLAGFIM